MFFFKSIAIHGEMKEVRELGRKLRWKNPSISVLGGGYRDKEIRVIFHHRCACFGREINSISFEISSFDLKVLSNQTGLYYHQHFREG